MGTNVATLDNILIVQQPLCRSVFSRLFQAVNICNGEIIPSINCHSWRCPIHRAQWGKKWGAIIQRQLDYTPCDLLLNLTTSEAGFTAKEVALALQVFIRAFRHAYGNTEYVKVTEAARKDHSQVHFHLLIISPLLRDIIPPKPENWPKKLSWPEPLFEQIKELWCNALRYAAPTRKPTTVVWCQPPVGTGSYAARYAIGYITGRPGKDEEPDETWKGRKLTYSRRFFHKPASHIWSELLTEWFGPPEVSRYFWQPKDLLDFDKLKPGDEEAFRKIINMPIMKARYQEAIFYARNGHFPTDVTAPSKDYRLIESVAENGQYQMELKR
jgi:hypothetical protein